MYIHGLYHIREKTNSAIVCILHLMQLGLSLAAIYGSVGLQERWFSCNNDDRLIWCKVPASCQFCAVVNDTNWIAVLEYHNAMGMG